MESVVSGKIFPRQDPSFSTQDPSFSTLISTIFKGALPPLQPPLGTRFGVPRPLQRFFALFLLWRSLSPRHLRWRGDDAGTPVVKSLCTLMACPARHFPVVSVSLHGVGTRHSAPLSLRGAQRRGNLLSPNASTQIAALPLVARNDKGNYEQFTTEGRGLEGAQRSAHDSEPPPTGV
jgi:hypothetical protein